MSFSIETAKVPLFIEGEQESALEMVCLCLCWCKEKETEMNKEKPLSVYILTVCACQGEGVILRKTPFQTRTESVAMSLGGS